MLLPKCLNYSPGLSMQYSPGRTFLKVIPADRLSITTVQHASIPDGARGGFALACLGCQQAGKAGGSRGTGKALYTKHGICSHTRSSTSFELKKQLPVAIVQYFAPYYSCLRIKNNTQRKGQPAIQKAVLLLKYQAFGVCKARGSSFLSPNFW